MRGHRENADYVDRRLMRSSSWRDHPESLAPYVPTPLNIVREMLSIAGTNSKDIVYDLGCGDGRILFTAVEEYNVKKAVGFDLNSDIIDGVNKKIIDNGLENQIMVKCSNFMKENISPATIIFIYLTTSGNSKLKPKLESELKEGARVISHDFPVNGWVTDRPGGVSYSIGSHKIFLYKIPYSWKNELIMQPANKEENQWKNARALAIDRK